MYRKREWKYQLFRLNKIVGSLVSSSDNPSAQEVFFSVESNKTKLKLKKNKRISQQLMISTTGEKKGPARID